MKSFHNGKIELHQGDCIEVLATLPDNSIDAVVTDPPYHLTSIVKRYSNEVPRSNMHDKLRGDIQAKQYARLAKGFMGKQWDGGDIAFTPELWAEVLRVLKPGGHCVAFGGTRTYHRLACAIEDAGFDVRDAIQWLYGSGFPKSHDVSKGIDRAAGAEREKVRFDVSEIRNPKATGGGRDGMVGATRPWIENALANGFHEKDSEIPATDAARQWAGYGTALKPACEIICLARKPLSEGTVAANVLRWGVGAINVNACRVEAEANRAWRQPSGNGVSLSGSVDGSLRNEIEDRSSLGRWPSNLCHDGSPEVLAGFPDSNGAAGAVTGFEPSTNNRHVLSGLSGNHETRLPRNDSGSAARFFYTAKADSMDRLNSKHPTVKPVDLMQWLVRMVCPRGGAILDPFAGTGTTGAAAFIEGCRCVLIEREVEYLADIERRMELLLSGPDERARKLTTPDPYDTLPLFSGFPV